jgi:ABC-type Zn uptake system ZnuABC Zn-binding protein ZnuA
VTFHDAFPYFLRRYDLHLVGVVEEVPDVDPSPRYLARLMRAIRASGVGVVFTEPQFNVALAKRLAEDLKLKLAELDVLETGPLTAGAYEDAMRTNLRVLNEQLR